MRIGAAVTGGSRARVLGTENVGDALDGEEETSWRCLSGSVGPLQPPSICPHAVLNPERWISDGTSTRRIPSDLSAHCAEPKKDRDLSVHAVPCRSISSNPLRDLH